MGYKVPSINFGTTKKDDPLADYQLQVQNKLTRIQDAGVAAPSNFSPLGPLLRALEILDRPRNSIATGLHSLEDGGGFMEGAWSGLTGAEHTSGSDLLEGIGAQTGNKWIDAALGFGTDVLTDPLTFVGGAIGRAAGGALKGAGAVKLGNLAENGIIHELVAPTVKNFGKGLTSSALGKSVLTPEVGKGVSGALGRAIGGIGYTDAKNVNHTIGTGLTSLYDTLGGLFNTKHINVGGTSLQHLPAGTQSDARAILNQGADVITDAKNSENYLAHKNIEELKGTGLLQQEDDIKKALVESVEQPMLSLREIRKNVMQNMPKNQRISGTQRFDGVAFRKARELLTQTTEKTKAFQKEITDLGTHIQGLKPGTPEYIQAVRKYNSYNSAFVLRDKALADRDAQILGKVGGDTAKAQLVKDLLQKHEGRMKVLGKREGIQALEIPNYILHLADTDDYETARRFFASNPDATILLSPNVTAHKKRIIPTIQDWERRAEHIDHVNKGMILDEVERVTGNKMSKMERDHYVYNVDFKELRKMAMDAGVDKYTMQTMPFEASVRPTKDYDVLAINRELMDAHFIARKKMFDDLKDIGVAKMIKDNPGDAADVNKLLDQGWVKVNVPGVERGYAIHPEMYKVMQRVEKQLTDDQNLAPLLQTWAKVQNIWKGTVTSLRPGWYMTNFFGNVFNNSLAGLKDPTWYAAALKLQSSKSGLDDFLRMRGVNMTGAEVMDQFRRFGLEGHGEMYGDFAVRKGDFVQRSLEGDTLKGHVKSVIKTAKNKKYGEAVKGATIDTGRYVGNAMETNAKLALFMHQIAQGKSAKQAADVVKEYLFDYTDLTNAERKLKLLMPFYTFTRKNLPLQLKTLVTHPEKYLNVMRVQQATMQASGQDEQTLDTMPPWMRLRAFGTGNKDNFFMANLPWETADQFMPDSEIGGLMGAVKPVASAALNMVSPLVKTPLIELPLNISTFTGQPIEKYAGEQVDIGGGTMVSPWTKYLLSQVGTGRDAMKAAQAFSQEQNYKGVSQPLQFDNPLLQYLSAIGGVPVQQFNADNAALYRTMDYNAILDDYIKKLKAQGAPVRTVTEIKKAKKKGTLSF